MVVYLRIQPETVLARLKGDTTRPLLKGDDSGERVRTLMKQREAHYLSGAEFVLDVDQKNTLGNWQRKFLKSFKNTTLKSYSFLLYDNIVCSAILWAFAFV